MNVNKVLIYLDENQIRVKRHSINPANDTTLLTQHSPLHKVPFMTRNDGASFFESIAICQYFDTTLRPKQSLFGNTPEEITTISAVVRLIEIHLTMQGFLAMRQNDPKEGVFSPKERSLFAYQYGMEQANLALNVLENLLKDHAFLAGDRFSMADVVFFATFQWRALRNIYPESYTHRPYLSKHYQTLLMRPSMRDLKAVDE